MKILSNRIQCMRCFEIIESKYRNDLKYCKCGLVGVDGGKDYLRRCGKKDNYIELSEFLKEIEKGKMD